MKKLILALAAAALSHVALAAKPLLSPAELQPLLSNPAVRVIDARDPKSYAQQHIPGAVNAPYGSWRGPATNPGTVPELPQLTALVQALGLTPQTHAVVVTSGADSTDFGASARVYWTLKVLGLQELSILNGGMEAWSAAKLPTDNQPVKVAASTYQPQLDTRLIATREQVVSQIGDKKVSLIDARPAAFFRGETKHPAASVPGTVKGAVNLENSRWFAQGSAAMVSPADAQKVAADAKLAPNDTVVSFCNTGHWAATNWFAMSEILGQKNVKLYPGSMVDWTQAPDALPMDNAPAGSPQARAKVTGGAQTN